jgi:hypothetical protein
VRENSITAALYFSLPIFLNNSYTYNEVIEKEGGCYGEYDYMGNKHEGSFKKSKS